MTLQRTPFNGDAFGLLGSGFGHNAGSADMRVLDPGPSGGCVC